jgi:polar amino acid transport system substrate-binding protein
MKLDAGLFSNKAACSALLFCLLPILQPAFAGNSPAEIVLASEEWPNATNGDGNGLYWDIVRAVYEPVGIKPKFIIRTYNGAVSLVKKNRVDAAVGIYPDQIKGGLFSRYPFIKDHVLVLFKRSRLNQWAGQDSLKQRRVAWIKGYAYDHFLEVPVRKHEFSRREMILRRLNHDHIDFFMDSRNNMESVLNTGIVQISRYTVETVMALDRYLVFADNRKGKKLKVVFDQRFPHLVESGEIEQLFAKWNW